MLKEMYQYLECGLSVSALKLTKKYIFSNLIFLVSMKLMDTAE